MTLFHSTDFKRVWRNGGTTSYDNRPFFMRWYHRTSFYLNRLERRRAAFRHARDANR